MKQKNAANEANEWNGSPSREARQAHQLNSISLLPRKRDEEMELELNGRVVAFSLMNELVMGRRPLCRTTIPLQSISLISASACLPFAFTCSRQEGNH